LQAKIFNKRFFLEVKRLERVVDLYK